MEDCRKNYYRKFQQIMGVIDHWAKEKKTEDKKRERGGPFKFLQEGLVIKDIAVTAGKKCCAKTLKMYMATEILELISYKVTENAKWSYATLEKHLSAKEGERTYKSFRYEELENCFSIEKNREAALRLINDDEDQKRLMQLELIKGEEFGYFYLLEKLRSKVRENWYKYWKKCEIIEENENNIKRSCNQKDMGRLKSDYEKTEESEKDMEEEKRKEQYMKCLMAVALHEIYMCELAERLNGKEEKKKEDIKTKQESLKLPVHGKTKMEEAVEKSVKQLKEATEMFELFRFHVELGMEHMSSLYAEWQLVAILERKNLMLDYPNRKIGSLLECYFPRKTETFTHPDRNRGDNFKRLHKYFKDEFLPLIEKEDPQGKNLSMGIDYYFLLAGKSTGKNAGEEQEKLMRAAEDLVGLPMAKYLYKERRKKEDERRYYW